MQLHESAAQKFINDKLNAHPNIKGIFTLIGSAIGFIFGGRALVWLGQKVIFTAGYVAETVLMFATLWVTSEYVAGDWINGLSFMPQGMPTSLNSLSVMAFSLLPELILFSAIVTTFKHWWITCHQPTRLGKCGEGVWAVLYTIPTGIFLWMTLITLQSLGANHGNIVDAGSSTIQIRCIAGWLYALIEMIHPAIRKAIAEMSGGVIEPQQPVTSSTLAPVSVPQNEPVSLDDLVLKMTPILTQIVAQSVPPALPPEPINYDQLAQSLLPHFAGQIHAMRTTIIEEVKASVPQITESTMPPVPQLESGQKPVNESGKKPVKKVTRTTRKQTDEERLEAAVQEMISQGKRPSGRGISVMANVGKYKATEWLKVAHPEYVEGRSSDQQSDQLGDQETDESVSDTTLSGDWQVTDEVTDEVTDILSELGEYQPTPEPLQSDQIEPHSDEFPAIVLEPEMVEA